MSRPYGILVNLCLLFVMSGCATRNRQCALSDSLEQPRPDAYYAAKSALPEVAVADAPETDFLSDMQQQLMHSKGRWEAALKNDVAVVALTAVGPEGYTAFRQLAADPNLDARLAMEIDLATLIGLASELNPTIQAAAAQLQATLEQYPQATQLDNILQQYNAFTKQLDTFFF